jgi:hypothetical protein
LDGAFSIKPIFARKYARVKSFPLPIFFSSQEDLYSSGLPEKKAASCVQKQPVSAS